MDDKFMIPFTMNNLNQNNENSHTCYKVMTIQISLSDKQLLGQLRRIDTEIFNQYQRINRTQNFDFLYCLIQSIGQNIENKSMKILEKLSDTIHHLLTHILKKIQCQNQDILTLRISFKMIIFLTLYFISVTCLKKVKNNSGDLMTQALNKQKGKKKIRNQNIQLSKNIIQNQKEIINQLRNSLNINFNQLWQNKSIDNQLFKKYSQICIKIIQSNLVKDQNNMKFIFQILEIIIKFQPQIFKNIQIILINLVYQSQIIDNLVQFFSQALTPQIQKLCTETIVLIVIYIVQKTNLSSQSSSLKNTRQFLSKLSEKIPRIFYSNLSCFIRLYQHQSYYLRNAISDILTNIIKYVLNNQEQENIKPRQKFITTLLQRIYDKNSFCRSHIMNLLGQLTIEKVIPKHFLIFFLKAGIDRIKDQSINTRRKSLQLINIILDQFIGQEIREIQQLDKEMLVLEMDFKVLAEQQEKLKSKIQLIQNEQQLQQLTLELKLIKKRILTTKQKEIQFLQQKELFNLIYNVIQTAKILLGSKNQTDVLQTIRLFIRLYRMKIPNIQQILPTIRLLIFSKQKKIKDQVLTTFIQLHLNKKSQDVSNQLIKLFHNATPQELSALQQILQICIMESLDKKIIIIKSQVFFHLWNTFIQYLRNQCNINQTRAIITILRVMFSKDNTLMKQQNMQSFLNILKNYVENGDPDYYLLKEIAKIICLDFKFVQGVAYKFIIALIYILVNCQGTMNNQWYSASQNILNCIFKICPNPQKVSELFIIKLNDKLQINKNVKSLSHFIFTLGHNCLKYLIYLDLMENKIKSKRQKQILGNENNQEQFDQVMGGLEAQLEQKIQQIQQLTEQILQDPFISKWVKIVENIVNNFQNGNELQIIAVLTFCKFMCLSAHYCQKNFPQILKILTSTHVNSAVKNNIIIAIGDLLHRFPNIVEPYNRYLYQNLRDSDPRVRKTTLTVLTHLSLNDMIKVRSDMCDIALLFTDTDLQIQSLVKQFFHEMNKKDPKNIFNLIPEALQKFSDQDLYSDQSTFTIFLTNIIPLMEKDKFSQSLVIKLCQRLSNSLNILQVKNTAHCLAEININQKGLKRILENFEGIRKTLETPQVNYSFRSIIAKCKKNFKNQLKSLIEQLEQKVANSGEQIFNASEIKRRNLQRANKKRPRKKRTNIISNTSIKRIKKRGKDQQFDGSDEEDSLIQIPNPGRKVGASRRKNNNKMRIIEENWDDQSIDDDDSEYSHTL